MTFFNFKKKNSINPGQTISVSETSGQHPLIKRCQYLNEEYGLLVPDVYQDLFMKSGISEKNPYYKAFWKERHDYLYLEIFYTQDFVAYVIRRFSEIFGEQADYKALQALLENGEYGFLHKENRFWTEHTDLSFLDACYEERGRNQDDLIIVLDVCSDCGRTEYMILTSDKKGYPAVWEHGTKEEIQYNGHIITYHALNYHRMSRYRFLKK
ncbi:hypothetical protein ACM46_17880 [Chryseobacterium angstadtii]|uniref:Uncharacterized protein n=1 Tax=Chryseobacterium angstadtii TaxID=558151 RepID=A0A0J7I1I8_9FLAO|nr:hypothetical protein [Chryseobacterium angstadtii]KMQ60112.1 hypothetical protein ACM46_17880 [Chryseobacterium angstadtii]